MYDVLLLQGYFSLMQICMNCKEHAGGNCSTLCFEAVPFLDF